MRNPITGAVVALSLALAALPASAAIVYVDKYSPGPAHDGKSWQTAFPTILPGYAAAKAGDEVWVGPGTYPEAITMKPNVSLYGGFIGFEFFRDQRVGIQGLTTLSADNRTLSPLISATGATITPATVLDGFTFVGRGAANLGSAVVCAQSSPTISHNVFAGLVTYNPVILCTGGSPVITNNIITANGGGNEGRGVPAVSTNGTSGTITNNTIAGNAGYAISGSGNPLVANNIVAYNQGGFQISPQGGGKTPVYRNNCLYANATAGPHEGTDPTGKDGNITADPKFAMYAYGNLHIAADSPCRDAGDDSAVAAGDTDIDLQPRIQGAHVDIGADESDGRTWTYTPRIVRVSATGNDANDGSTWALAKKSIQAGIDLASAYGGDVWVQGGTYLVSSRTEGPIRLKPFCYLYGGFAGMETALNQRDWVSSPTFLTAEKTPILTATAGYRVSAVDGFILSGGTSNNGSAAGITCSGASPYIRNNVFTRNTGPVVYCSVSSPVITNNAFYNNTMGSPAYVVGGSASFLTVIGNVFSGNGLASTVPALGSVYGDKSSTLLVTNNLFEGNSVGSNNASSGVSGVQGVGTIANNTFVNNRGMAIYPYSGTVANNIVAFNDTGINTTTTLLNVLSNCVYGNTSNYGRSDRTGKDGNISLYPMFKSLLSADYRLMDTSPCVGAGRDEYVLPGDVDLDGLPRIQGRHVDIGCYESSATSITAHWGDVARLLRIAGGLTVATPQDLLLLDTVTADAPHTLDLLDAQSLIRQFTTGL